MNNQGGLAASSDAVVERHVLGLHIYSEGAMFLSEGSLILQHPGLSGCGCWVPRTRRSGNYQKMLRSSICLLRVPATVPACRKQQKVC